MVKKACIWLAGRISYLLYTLLLLVLFLWLLFPEASVQRLSVRALNTLSPNMTWQMDSAALRLPGTLIFAAMTGYNADEARQTLVRVDTLQLQPKPLMSLRTGEPQAAYHLHLAGGTVSGTLILERDGWLRLTGTVEKVQLADIKVWEPSLQRTVEGELSGSFTGRLRTQGADIQEMRGNLRLENGQVELKRPILKHQWFPFDRVTMEVESHGDGIRIEAGQIDSVFFSGHFTGEARIRSPLQQSQLDFHGTLQPRPGFFSRVNNAVVLEAVRNRLRDRELPFLLSGEVGDPGIHFHEFSMLFEALEQEL
ncbi:type II secretion system protein GspN [Desulfobulbus alkaliphilus]|uniref:type II secretion system protein GspN n=1 Tax=Desulfobulbus alkaliphilus TaxID=869814 RepID=UPI001965C6BB|nr:type II secretion system protein GspN [Desulfobulbus alkaliphilus]MBM9536049.1 type II secretion system protein GspN [Desulfobulbus alkaliphilus]